MSDLTTSQIDRLGERLRKGPTTEQDLALLNAYRDSFKGAFDHVVQTLRVDLQVETTGRAAKTVASIIAKLKREHGRLSRMRDIAGCRVLVSDPLDQDLVVAAVQRLFVDVAVKDRRQTPNHGYRAAHLIVVEQQRSVEIQVRTQLQHLWAELSEKWTDLLPGLKYGEVQGEHYEKLLEASRMIQEIEAFEVEGFNAPEFREAIIASLARLTGQLGRRKT